MSKSRLGSARTIYAKDVTWQRARKFAQDNGISVSSLIAIAIHTYINQYEQKTKEKDA